MAPGGLLALAGLVFVGTSSAFLQPPSVLSQPTATRSRSAVAGRRSYGTLMAVRVILSLLIESCVLSQLSCRVLLTPALILCEFFHVHVRFCSNLDV